MNFIIDQFKVDYVYVMNCAVALSHFICSKKNNKKKHKTFGGKMAENIKTKSSELQEHITSHFGVGIMCLL